MSVQVTPEQMAALRATLLNTSGKTELHERFRALFMLKAVGGDEVIQIIAEGEYTTLMAARPLLRFLCSLITEGLSGALPTSPQLLCADD